MDWQSQDDSFIACNLKIHNQCSQNVMPKKDYFEHLKQHHMVKGDIRNVGEGNQFHCSLNPYCYGIQLSYIGYDGKIFLIYCQMSTKYMCIWATLLDTEDACKDYKICLMFDGMEFECDVTQEISANFHTEVGHTRIENWQVFYLVQGTEHSNLWIPFTCIVEKETDICTDQFRFLSI